MKPVILPTTDVNSDRGILVAWRVENRARVETGTEIAHVETSKAVIEVESPDGGFLLQAAMKDETVSLRSPIAYLFPDLAALERFRAELEAKSKESTAAAGNIRATQPAQRRAAELGIDLATLDTSRLITLKDVEAAAISLVTDYSDMPPPLGPMQGRERLLLIGGALGATQVLDILRDSQSQQAVAIVDDDRSTWGKEIFGVPLIGGTDRLSDLYRQRAFDAAIITIGSSIRARVKFRQTCDLLGIPLANAIDKTVRLQKDVRIGLGNVIAAFCHFGNSTVIGDNNFFSAHGSFDHHNVLGSDITTGPNCVTSGLVRIGSRVKMGMGVMIEPKVQIGDDAQIASGSVIVSSVPVGHAVKVKIVTTTVVPVRIL